MKKTRFSILMILCLGSILFSGSLFAGTSDVSLAWDPPDIATDVTGYKVYMGKASGTYTQSWDAGLNLAYKVTGLADGTYYFAATAYNSAKYESVYSNEVSVTLYSLPPGVPKNLKVNDIKITFGVTIR